MSRPVERDPRETRVAYKPPEPRRDGGWVEGIPNLVGKYQGTRQKREKLSAGPAYADAGLWLTLGPDVLKLDGTRHDAELMEARGLAMSRWGQLLNLEQQVIREEQYLAARSKKRPTQPGDDLLPDRTLTERDRAWAEETKGKARWARGAEGPGETRVCRA